MWKKRILWSIPALIVLVQFIPVDRSVPVVKETDTFYVSENVPEDVVQIMDNACMDCHSYNTTYPWYSYIAPVSWWLEDHIEEGREHLNFSVWAGYNAKRRDHKLEEMDEEVKEGEMPLDSYTWAHSEARLSQEQRDRLASYFSSLRKQSGPENQIEEAEQEEKDDDEDDHGDHQH